jgi:DNA-binding NtrC family response regulator
MARVLVVEDNELMRDGVVAALSARGHEVVAVAAGTAAIERFLARLPDVVVTDLQMPGLNGLDLLAELRKLDEHVPVVLMTAFGSVETAVSALRQGAFDYVTKPFTPDELAVALERAIAHARIVRENQVLKAAAAGTRVDASGPVGSSPATVELRERLPRIAASSGAVLVTGEPGSGKRATARAVHAASPRKDGPFLTVGCGAADAASLDRELFGVDKGPDGPAKGRVELASGGTLVLDEVTELPAELQGKILRLVQDRVFERSGSPIARPADVRIIATSSRDLADAVAAGSFRRDLAMALGVLPVRVPPLRERAADVAEIAERCLAAVAARDGRTPPTLSREAQDLLVTYPWPGNVRELENICERAAVLAPGESVSADLLRPWLLAPGATAAPGSVAISLGTTPAAGIACDGQVTLESIEKDVILATLERHRGHRQRSAAALGIGVRTLGLKLKKWKDEASIPAHL